MNFFWVGFYLVKEGSTGTWSVSGTDCLHPDSILARVFVELPGKKRKPYLVPNVEEFPGHIACSSASQSEIVLPAFKNGEVALVLDVDSDKLNDFDEVDQTRSRKSNENY